MNAIGLGLTISYKDLASSGIGRTGKSLNRLGSSANRMGSSSSEAFGKFQAGVAKLAVAAVAIRGVVTALRGATKAASDFGKAIGEVSTLTSEAEIPTERLRDISLEMSDAFGGAPVDQAKALYQAISAGASDAASAQDVLTESNKLAIGGVTDVGTALDGLTSTLNAYGMEFSRANEVSDAFFIAVKKGKTTVGELSAVVGRLAPTANAVGISMDEMLASIAAVTTQGLKTSEATTGLKAALANIIKPSKDAQKAAKALGVDFSTAALRSKGLNQFLKEITGSAKFNKDSLGELFTSVEGLNAITALTANQGVKFQDTLDAMANKSGATKTAFDKMADTMAFSENKFAALVEVSKVMIGEALEPLARKVIEFGSVALKWFNKLPEPMRDMIVKGVALVGVIVALAAAGAAVAGAIGFIAPALVALAGPVLLVVGVVGGLIAAFATLDKRTETHGKLIDSLSRIWERLKETAGVVITDIKAFWDGLVEGFRAGIRLAEPAFEGLADALNTLSVLMGGAEDSSDDFAGAGNRLGRVIASIAEGIVEDITRAIDILNGFIAGWKELGDPLADAKSGFADVDEELTTLLTDMGLMNNETERSASAWQKVGGAMAAVVKILSTNIGDAVRLVGGLISGLADIFVGQFKLMAGLLTGDWAMAWEGAKQMVFGVVKVIITVLSSMARMIAQTIDAIGKMAGKDLGAVQLVNDLEKSIKSATKAGLGIATVARKTGGITAPVEQPTEEQLATEALLGAPAPRLFEPLGGGRGAPTAAPEAPIPPPLAAPAGAGGPIIDPATIKAAAVAAAVAASAAAPDKIVKATMTVDGDVLGEVAARFNKKGGPNAPVEIE